MWRKSLTFLLPLLLLYSCSLWAIGSEVKDQVSIPKSTLIGWKKSIDELTLRLKTSEESVSHWKAQFQTVSADLTKALQDLETWKAKYETLQAASKEYRQTSDDILTEVKNLQRRNLIDQIVDMLIGAGLGAGAVAAFK